jgi:hypothetical protein
MRLFLDDLRVPSDIYETTDKERWIPLDDVPMCIHLARHLKEGDILSLDHDLGDSNPFTGYDVLKQIEKEMGEGKLTFSRGLPTILIHSANPVGMQMMRQAIQSIERLHRQ